MNVTAWGRSVHLRLSAPQGCALAKAKHKCETEIHPPPHQMTMSTHTVKQERCSCFPTVSSLWEKNTLSLSLLYSKCNTKIMLSSLHPFFWPAHVFQMQNEIHCVNNCDVLHSVISETKLGWSGGALLMWHMYYFLTVLLTFFVLSSLSDLVLFTLPYLIHFSLVVLPVWFHTICSFIHFWKWNTNTTACKFK